MFKAGAYIDLILGGEGGESNFFLIKAQNVQVKLSVIFEANVSLIFVVFFFFF
jgi:hypothetical protein